MLYTDALFLFFFLIVWAVGRILRNQPYLREWWFIIVSLLVIASWGLFGLYLFLGVLVFNYAGAGIMLRVSRNHGQWVLRFLIAANIGTLALFKYFNFFGEALHQGLRLKVPHFSLGIPLAISFYTFHIISYLVDVHAGRVQHTKFRHYLFYLSFFPHVIAGPIVRAWQLVPQIGRIRRVRTDLMIGFHLLVVGFFLKAVSANNIAEMIDPVWSGEAGFNVSMVEHWLVAFLYYCQIYADFAGYSLMALGMARLMGYRLPPNFRAPMLAASLQEFWQRWHITLSRWLRDYLYIPLGGNRGSSMRVASNVMVTMVLGGLWHGAGWGFLIWGAMHGAGILTERFLKALGTASGWMFSVGKNKNGIGFEWKFLPPDPDNRPLAPKRFSYGHWFAVQLWVTLAWVFFRAPDLSSALHFIGGMADFRHKWHLVHHEIVLALIFAIPVVLHHGMPWVLRHLPRRLLIPLLGVTTGGLLVANFVIFSPSKAFIYFKF